MSTPQGQEWILVQRFQRIMAALRDAGVALILVLGLTGPGHR
jgi:hypothetical protein